MSATHPLGLSLRTLKFLNPVAVAVATPSAKAITAPGLRTETPLISSTGGGSKRQTDAPEKTPLAVKRAAKRQRKAANAKEAAKKKDEEHAKALAAAKREGKGNRDRGGKGNRGGGGDAKGGGKGNLFPDGCLRVTSDNKPICAKWNKGDCKFGASCRFAHVCWWCEDDKHTGVKHQHG